MINLFRHKAPLESGCGRTGSFEHDRWYSIAWKSYTTPFVHVKVRRRPLELENIGYAEMA